jgi:hypothetical protein
MAADQLVAGLCSLFLLLATGGCAGTPWGDTLSGSFPSPGPSGSGDPSPLPQGGSAPSPPPEAKPPAPAGARPQTTHAAAKPQPPQPPPAPARKLPPDPRPGLSSPYRVTLRLPLADPSAPAEAVTQALRAAGIVFEVETIERVKGGASAPQAPSAGDGAPAVRPAPPPR